MKKLITMAIAILLTAGIAAFASGTPATMPKNQTGSVTSFSKIIVAGDIDLRLKETDEKMIDVSGNSNDIENVNWKIRGGILYLQSKKGSLKNKVTVTIGVNRLREIVVDGQSSISSDGILLSPDLYVYMKDDCYVAIKSVGHIYVVNGENTEVEVKRLIGNVHIGR